MRASGWSRGAAVVEEKERNALHWDSQELTWAARLTSLHAGHLFKQAGNVRHTLAAVKPVIGLLLLLQVLVGEGGRISMAALVTVHAGPYSVM